MKRHPLGVYAVRKRRKDVDLFNGIPVVRLHQIEQVIASANLARQYRDGPMPLADFLQLPLSHDQRSLAERFQPKVLGLTLEPIGSEERIEPYFRVSGVEWATMERQADSHVTLL